MFYTYCYFRNISNFHRFLSWRRISHCLRLSGILAALILQLYKNRNRRRITESINYLTITRFKTSLVTRMLRSNKQECFALVLFGWPTNKRGFKLVVNLPSFARQQCEMTKFALYGERQPPRLIFLNFYFKFIAVSQI